MTHPVIQEMEKSLMKKAIPGFNVGDTLEVRTRIREGDKERIQPFVGTVIARKGTGVRETVVVRRIVQGEGVERIFPLHSPHIVEIRVRHKGEVRRAKLYYLRGRTGKATRIRGRAVFEVAGAEGTPAETEPAKSEPPASDSKDSQKE